MLKKLISLGISENLKKERKFQLNIRNSLALALSLAVTLNIITHLLFGDDSTIYISYINYYIASFGILYAHHKKKFILAEYIISLYIPILFFISCLFVGSAFNAEYLLFITGIASCYMFEPLKNRATIRRRFFFLHLLLFIGAKIYYIYFPSGFVTIHPSTTILFNLFNGLAAFFIVYRIASSSFHFREQLYDTLQQLSAQQEQIITDRTREIQEKSDALERSNQEIHRLAYISAHDLREPLRNIIGFSQLLHRDLKVGKQENVEEYLEFIDMSVRKMDRLTKDVVNYTELESYVDKVETVNIQEIDINPIGGLDC